MISIIYKKILGNINVFWKYEVYKNGMTIMSRNLKRYLRKTDIRLNVCNFPANVMMHWSLTGGIKMLIRIVVCRELSLFATEWLTKVHGKRSQRSARKASRQLSSSRLDCTVLSLVRRNIRSPFLQAGTRIAIWRFVIQTVQSISCNVNYKN